VVTLSDLSSQRKGALSFYVEAHGAPFSVLFSTALRCAVRGSCLHFGHMAVAGCSVFALSAPASASALFFPVIWAACAVGAGGERSVPSPLPVDLLAF
jgi:hypothetical protein